MTAPSAYDRLVDALHEHGAKVVGNGDRVRAQCPSHGSTGLSLLVSRHDDGAGVHCFTGCDTADVVGALGLAMRDLFDRADTGLTAPYVPRPRRPAPHPLGDPEHWCDRALQQDRIDADPDCRARRATEVAAAAPRPGDHPGGPVTWDGGQP